MADAAIEPNMPVQLGGVAYGLYWYVELVAKIPISVAEFLADVANAIHFAPLVARAKRVLMETDSLATDFDLRKEHASSPGMSAVLQAALECNELNELKSRPGCLRGKHTYGDGNILADKA